MSSVGKISLDLNVNSKNFNKQVNGIEKQTKSAFNSMSVAVGNIIANMATKAAASIGNFVKDSINRGSELTELENVVDSVFTTMADKVDVFAKNALDTYGLTEKQAKRMVGTFGAMAKAFKYSEQQAYGMSTALTGLAGDVASFYNLDIDEAYTKLKSVFTGETESLKELGVVMTQAALDEFALANGFGKTTAKMSEQEKVALRLAFVQDRLSVATGDVIRTQDSWANQTRKLQGQIDSFKTAIGQGLINILTPVIKVINIIMSKLVQLANAFKSFTEMITGRRGGSGGGSPGDAMSDVADAAESAAGSTADVEDAANGAAKAAKKAQKSLMSFDEINKLTKTDDTSGGSGGGAGGGVSFDDIDFGDAVEEQERKSNAAIEAIKKKLKELVDEFKKGFKDGLGSDFEASLKRIQKHLDNIKKSLKNIFTDPKVLSAADNWAKKVAFALGQIAGSVVSIGTSIAENLIGGVDKYLDQNKDYIKQRIIGMLNVSADVWSIMGELSKAIASIFEVFRSDEAKQCTADLIGIVANAQLGMAELSLRIGKDIMKCIAQPIIDNKDKIKTALENTIKPIGTILSTLNTAVKDTFDKIFEVYDAKIGPMFDKIANGISDIVGTILDSYNTYIAPVLDRLATKFSGVWAESIQPMLNKAIEFIGKVANAIGTLWENVLAPLVSWIISTLVPVIAPILETLGTLILNLLGTVCDVIGGIFDVLGGLIDFIVGVFSGDWSLAWEGIKSIFTGIWNAICGLFKGIWNTLKGIVTAALQVITGVITTVFNAILGIFKTIWGTIKNVFKTILDAISSIVTSIFNGIKTFIGTVMGGIKSTISSIWGQIKTSVSSIVGGIKSTVTSIWGQIKTSVTSIVGGIKTGVSNSFGAMKSAITGIMSNIKSSITNTFNGIWNFMKGIINTILGGIEKLVNGVIKGLNLMIGAMNKLKFDVPDWVPSIGGKKFGFNIPKLSTVSLPRLAEGGYVRANQPQPVIIGDNRTQGEIVSPEGKMLDITLQALEEFFSRLKDAGYSSNNDGKVGDIIIPIYLDGSQLDEVIVTAQQRRKLRSGGR